MWGVGALMILLALSVLALVAIRGDPDETLALSAAGVTFVDLLPRQVGKVQSSTVAEASALIKSTKHPGVYWTLCDAHNPPYLFAINEAGKLLATIQPRGARNTDWEALATDTAGHIYIGDIGNNRLRHGHGTLYEIDEPDHLPADPLKPTLVPVTAMYQYSYPGQPFDAEALVIQDRVAYVINKTVKRGETWLYQLHLDTPGGIRMVEPVGRLPYALTFVADASLSPDHRRLALTNKFYTAVFELPTGQVTDLLKVTPRVYRYRLHRIEGCAWDGADVVLIDENRLIYRLTP